MKQSREHKAIVIGRKGTNTDLLIQEVGKHWSITKIIYEDAPPASEVIKRRTKKIGFIKTMGQVAFLKLIAPLLSSKKRRQQLLAPFGDLQVNFTSDISSIENVNSAEFHALIKDLQTDIVFINGTRILSKKTIELLNAPIVNIHVGITPKYRGVHGGYWALYDDNKDLFGVTLHYLDSGIDTGKIIDQVILMPSAKDNYRTYPLLQYISGLELIRNNVDALKSGQTKKVKVLCEKDKLHYHPRFFQYLGRRIFKGVK